LCGVIAELSRSVLSDVIHTVWLMEFRGATSVNGKRT
jgi:hypothetical protein